MTEAQTAHAAQARAGGYFHQLTDLAVTQYLKVLTGANYTAVSFLYREDCYVYWCAPSGGKEEEFLLRVELCRGCQETHFHRIKTVADLDKSCPNSKTAPQPRIGGKMKKTKANRDALARKHATNYFQRITGLTPTGFTSFLRVGDDIKVNFSYHSDDFTYTRRRLGKDRYLEELNRVEICDGCQRTHTYPITGIRDLFVSEHASVE